MGQNVQTSFDMHRLGFVSYLHGLYFNSFQTTKRYSYDGYSIYIAMFTSFFQGVFPVGVTHLRPYFTLIISHNSVNIHWIPTKVDFSHSYLGNSWSNFLQI